MIVLCWEGDMTENDNPSLETKKAIADGVNWLADWYKERCEAGIISSDEYLTAIQKLKDVKIYTTKQGMNRITEELEKQNLHFSESVLRNGATISGWKEFMKRKNTFPQGWCARNNIEEPVIILDVDAILQKSGGDRKKITSTVVHELTHLTADVFDSEASVKDAVNGINITDKAQNKRKFNLEHNETVAKAEITPNIISDTNTPLVVPEVDNAKMMRHSDTNQTRDFLKDGIMFNSYLDGENEMYARIMELRYNTGLKADMPVNENDLKTLEDDNEVLDRYKTSFIQTILNDVAVKEGTKSQMHCQSLLAQHSLAKLKDKNGAESLQAEKNNREAEQNISVLISKKNENSYS